MTRLARWLLGFPVRRTTRRAMVRNAPAARLRVEAMEDRVVPAVIYSDTYPNEWTSPGGTAEVTVTVTDEVSGFYRWSYHLHNIDFGDTGPFTSPIGLFAIPVAEPEVISNVQSSTNWD